MKYKVQFETIVTYQVTVQAKTAQEAIDKAEKEMEETGGVEIDSSGYEFTQCDIV